MIVTTTDSRMPVAECLLARLRVTALCTVAALLPGMLYAADQSTSSEQVEEVVITGTLIRGNAPVGSALIAVDRKDMDQSGATTVSDMLKELPQVDNLGVTESSRTGTGGATNIVWGNSINLRGLSPYATLTLVDGHRAPPSGTSGATVDPDDLPSLMLQRIDIVADGASATYGSDAIAGVVNLILRRDVEGVEARARYGDANSYEENDLGLLAGHNWGTGQISIGFEQKYHSDLNGRDRAFFESNQTNEGGYDYASQQCNPGTIVVNGVSYAIPKGGVTPATAASLVPGTSNSCDPSKNQDILPEARYQDMALTFDQQLGSLVSLYGDATYAERTFDERGAPPEGPVVVPSTNAFFVAPPGTNATSETVDYNFANDFGPNTYDSGKSVNAELTAGLKFKLPADWLINVDGTLGRDSDYVYSPLNGLNNGALGAALASGNPATALNVFGGANSPSVIKGIFNSEFYGPGFAGEQVAEAQGDGPLFHLPGGDVRLAVGGQWRHDELTYGINSGPVGGPQLVLRQILNRHSESAFAELAIPIVGSGNAVPGIRSLDLDIAGRYEDYSDFGNTTHPKIGLNWSPAEGWLAHASYGTSFRAPLLSELVGPLHGVFVQTYSDPISPTGTSVGYTLGGGNLNLQPETATTYSFGVDFTPNEHTKVSLTYYNIDYKNQISSYLSDLTILQQTAQLGGLVTRCPSAACSALIAQYITGPNPLPVFGPILANPSVFVNGLEENLGTTKTQGFDFQSGYSFRTESVPGLWSVGLSATLTTQFDVSFTPGGPSFNELNTVGYPLRFRLRANGGWADGPWTTMLFVNFENGYTNTEATPNQSIDSYTTVDVDAAYDFGKVISSSWAQNFVARLHIMNIGNTAPPFVSIPISPNGGGGFDPGAANPIMRMVSLTVDKKF